MIQTYFFVPTSVSTYSSYLWHEGYHGYMYVLTTHHAAFSVLYVSDPIVSQSILLEVNNLLPKKVLLGSQ